MDLTHTYIGDLVIELESPSGTTVVLHDRSGGTTNDIVGTYGVDLSPAEPLSGFHGESSDGTWELRVRDEANGDTGTVNAWSLDLCGRPPEVATPEMLLRDVTLGPSGPVLRWWPYPGMDSYRVYRAVDPSSAAAFADVTAEDGDPGSSGVARLVFPSSGA